MAKNSYKVVSPEGAAYTGVEEGELVELDLEPAQERAVVAAGWLEPARKKREG